MWKKNYLTLFPNNLLYPLEELSIPPAMDGDGNPYHFSNEECNLLKNYDLDSGFENLVKGQIRAEKFSDGCV
jgi:hypothetical protein